MSDTSLVIENVVKNERRINYNIKDVEAVLFERVFLNGYRIGIKQGNAIETYELSLLGRREVERLKNDLRLLHIKIV